MKFFPWLTKKTLWKWAENFRHEPAKWPPVIKMGGRLVWPKKDFIDFMNRRLDKAG